MTEILITVSLACLMLAFYTLARAMSQFGWSRLEELEVSRNRRMAVEECLEERDLTVTVFVLIGSAFLAALSTRLAWDRGVWQTAAQVGGLALAVWLLPELFAWKLGYFIVLYIAPALHSLTARPFRAFRRLLYGVAPSHRQEEAYTTAEPTASAPVDEVAHEMFRTALRLKHVPVRDIMSPRTEIVAIPQEATLREATETILRSGYSRLPVHGGTRDRIVGVVHAKDLLQFAGREEWDRPVPPELLRQPFYVPETKAVSDLMEELLRTNVHMGIVLDEYGGTSGLVTLEDIVEELIGEIHDEYESPAEQQPLFKRIDERTVEVQAVMRVTEFNEEFDADLPEEEAFSTVGGFVVAALGQIPAKGAALVHAGTRITVLEADARRVIRLRAEFEKPAEANGGG